MSLFLTHHICFNTLMLPMQVLLFNGYLETEMPSLVTLVLLFGRKSFSNIRIQRCPLKYWTIFLLKLESRAC